MCSLLISHFYLNSSHAILTYQPLVNYRILAEQVNFDCQFPHLWNDCTRSALLEQVPQEETPVLWNVEGRKKCVMVQYVWETMGWIIMYFFLSCKTSESLVTDYHPKCLKGDVLLGEPETCWTVAPLLKAHLEGQCWYHTKYWVSWCLSFFWVFNSVNLQLDSLSLFCFFSS